MDVGDYVKYPKKVVHGKTKEYNYGIIKGLGRHGLYVDVETSDGVDGIPKYLCTKISRTEYDLETRNTYGYKASMDLTYVGNDYYFDESPDLWEQEYMFQEDLGPKCECGAEKTYRNVTNIHHSFWCPLKEEK